MWVCHVELVETCTLAARILLQAQYDNARRQSDLVEDFALVITK